MSKVFIKIIILFALIFNFTVKDVFAYKTCSGINPEAYITIKFNDAMIGTDAAPYIEDGRVFVPLRLIAELSGMDVNYYPDEKRITITGRNKNIELRICSNIISVNGIEKYIDAQPVINNGRTMIPLRAVSENLGIDILWDTSTLSVLLFKEGARIPDGFVQERHYTDEDLLWLSRIVTAETGWQSFDAKLAVANVVLNRVKTKIFPNTIYGVIFDTNYTVQFPPAHKDGFTCLIPTTESIVAAKMALEGVNNADECLFFNYVPFRSKSINDLYAIYDGEYFYY